MDQAAVLREKMAEKQRQKKIGITEFCSVITTESFRDEDVLLKTFALKVAEQDGRKVPLVGLKVHPNYMDAMYISNHQVMKKEMENVLGRVPIFKGDINQIDEYLKDEKFKENWVKTMKELEENARHLLFYAGRIGDQRIIRWIKNSSQVLLMMDTSEKDINEVISLIEKINLLKLKEKIDLGVIVKTLDYTTFCKVYNKIQDNCWERFKYNVEPVGHIDINHKIEKKIEYNLNLRMFTNSSQSGRAFSDLF